MKHRYGAIAEKVPSINSEDFLPTLRDNYIDIGFLSALLPTLRFPNYQAFPGTRALLNPHPGRLRQYRGVITAIGER